MRSSYKKLGPYIREISIKNADLSVTTLFGVSISKKFIPSIANTIGTNMANYKIVRRHQFAYGPVTSRNSDKVSIALLNEDECIVSTSYTVFEIIDNDALLPEYLMMWFRRPEFDRYARFMSHGSVRELFGWEEMCDVDLPIPSIRKQQEIVKEYQTITDRIKLIDGLNKQLGESEQAIYKHWFIDFEFPTSAEHAAAIGKPEREGQPYKSNGGEMVYNVVLDQEVPRDWEDGGLHDLADLIDGDRGTNYPSQVDLMTDGYCLFLNTGNVTKKGFEFSSNTFVSQERDKLLRKGKLQRGDVVLTTRGTVGNAAYYSDKIEYDNIRINSGMILLRAMRQKAAPLFVYYLLKSRSIRMTIDSFMSGSAQQHLPIKDIKRIAISIPPKQTIDDFVKLVTGLHQNIDVISREMRVLNAFAVILLCKASKLS